MMVCWDEQRCIYSVTLGSWDITVSWRKGELGWGGGSTGSLEMLPSSPSQLWRLTAEGLGHQLSVWGRLSLHFLSCPLYRQFPSPFRQDENLCWCSLPPHPPVWGQGLQRLRPRGGTSQGGQEYRSLILLLESASPAWPAQPVLRQLPRVPHIFFPLDPKMYVY